MPEPRSSHQIRELALYMGSDPDCAAILALSPTLVLVVGEISIVDMTRPRSDITSGDGSCLSSCLTSNRVCFLHLAELAIRPSAHEFALLLDPGRDAWIDAFRTRRSSSLLCSPERWRDWPAPFDITARETVLDRTLRSPQTSLANFLIVEMVAVQTES